jgi:hypothetical protein
METHSYQFEIDRCNPKIQTKNGRANCHEEKKIDEWVGDIDVEIWTLNKVIDFDAYGDDPTYIVNDL